ncbi:peptide deformylase [bacterium]|nr:peptide deformylase [bacterium]
MSKLLPIVTNPNPILRKTSEKVNLEEILKPEFKDFLLDMEKTMLVEDGVGLAAPQIAKNIRVIIVKNNRKVIPMINPEITKTSWSKVWGEEGCLSVPDTYGEVERYKKINITYFDKKGNKKKITANNFFARVIQHEIDHLDGILFIDKAKNIQKIK